MKNFLNLTVDQINYNLQNGLMSKEDADEYVKVWNANKVSTFAEMLPQKFKRGCITIYGWQVVVFDSETHKPV